MKLVKIRFTAWRDEDAARRTPALQRQLDYWTTRVDVLSREAANIKNQLAIVDSEVVQKSLARITADLQKVDAVRTLLLSAEDAEPNVVTGEAREHKKVGTFGYQIFDDAGAHVIRIVDEAGNDLPPKAVFSYELVEAAAARAGDERWSVGRKLRAEISAGSSGRRIEPAGGLARKAGDSLG